MERKNIKSPYSWVWIAATTIFCLLLSVSIIPGAAAQGSINPSQNSSRTQNLSSTIQNVFDFIIRNYVDEVDPQALFDGAMTGMFNALEDPYSSYLTASDMSDLNDTTQGSFGGVGLNITKAVGATRPDGKPSWVEVVSPIEDTPGWRAGINPGDYITEINGIPTETLTMDEVLGILRGTPGESVQIVVKRGEILEFPLTITRAVIEVPTVKYDMIGDIGYLRLLTFTPMTVERAIEAINEFSVNNYQGLILDLRNNYGGRLDSAIDICDLFLDGGLVVSTKSRIASENRTYTARRSSLVPQNIPIIVLINRGSASASEIVAGALKDRGRAYLVGETTFGKGSVQQVYPLGDSGFRITTARYYTPSDVNIDQIGIPPDFEVLFPEYTEEEAIRLNDLINANTIPSFVEQNPQATAVQIEAFAQSLQREYRIDLSLLRRLIRNEFNRTTFAPVYDLEYDVQLVEAVNIIRRGNFHDLMRNTKTLRALQEEAQDASSL